MAYLKTTYIEGDLYVQNSLKVSEYRTNDGSILATVKNIDTNYDGALDAFKGKFTIFDDDKGLLTKAPIGISNEAIPYSEENKNASIDGVATKALYTLDVLNYNTSVAQYPLGFVLNGIYSSNILLKSSPIFLHEGDTGNPRWSHSFEGSTQDIIYNQTDLFTLIVSTKSSGITQEVLFAKSYLKMETIYPINTISIPQGYSLESVFLKDVGTITKTELNTLNIEVSLGKNNNFTFDTTDTSLLKITTVSNLSVYDVVLDISPINFEIVLVSKEGDSFVTEGTISSFNVEHTIDFKADGVSITGEETKVSFGDRVAVSFDLLDSSEQPLITYFPNTTWGIPYDESLSTRKILVSFAPAEDSE